MENFDNTNNAPEQGQAEVSAEERLGQAMMEAKGQTVEESQTEEKVEEQPKETQQEIEDYLEKEVEVAGKKMKVKNVLKSYEEAQKKISQKSEKERAYEQLTQRLQENPKLAKAIQLAAQDENFQAVIDLYDKGYINRQQLERARQFLNSQGQSQTMSNQVNPEIENKLSQLEQYIQNMQLNNMKSVIRSDFNRLKENYNDVIESQGLDEKSLTQFAIDHNFTKQTQFGVAPDIEQALVAKIASNQDALKQLINMGKNEVKKTNEQVKQATVESSSTRQQQSSNKRELPDHIKAIFEAGPNSGSGF